MQEYLTIQSLADLNAFHHLFDDLLSRFQVFAFVGDLGAGKTTLIKELCKRRGVDTEEMSSPSFGIVNEYKTDAGAIFHFDWYRLKSSFELTDLGWDDYLNSNSLIFIEWPEIGEALLPEETVWVNLEVDEATQERILQITTI